LKLLILLSLSNHPSAEIAPDHRSTRACRQTETLIQLSRNFPRLNPDEKDTPLTDHLKSGGRAATALSTDQRRRDKFERIALPHLDAAYALVRWLTRNEADAGDVVQEAFLRALRYFDSYRDGDAKSWLLKIVRHTCYSWLACNRPAEVTSLEAEAECSKEVTAVSIDAEAMLESRSELQRLHVLIMKLPAPLREMLVLREFHELGYREIAEVTGVPIGTVMSRLYRARSQLLHMHAVTAPAAPDVAVPPSVERREPAAAVFDRSAVPARLGVTEQAAPGGP
jgi:RNA polymerase sigma-70 factor (ECF subfamily)